MTEVETSKRIVALISGTGQALQGLLDAVHFQSIAARVVAVFSHDRWSYGLLRAEREGIPALLHDFIDYRIAGRPEREYLEDLATRVAEFAPDLIVIAGWQQPLNEAFYTRFSGHILVLHSGAELLPRPGYPTRNPVSQIYEAYSAGLIREAQVSIQQLTSGLSHGRVVAQQSVPIYQSDRPIDLEERVHRVQQELLVHTLHLLLRDEHEPHSSDR